MGLIGAGSSALGVDVSLSRGLDLVLLAANGRVLGEPLKTDVDGLRRVIRETRPGVVAIDSPPAWGRSGRSRPLERRLMALGISIFATPSDPGDHPFYRWMRAGFAVFEAAAEEGYALYRGEDRGPLSAIEVFPHAAAVALHGRLPAPGESKRAWRRAALEAAGVETSRLRTTDQVDAALAALTGLRFLAGPAVWVGEPGEEVLVLPGPLPPRAKRSGTAS